MITDAFDLPEHLSRKADPALIAGDELQFAAIAETLEQSIADLSERLEVERKAPAGSGQRALDRDQEVHRLTARLRTLRRFGLDLCLGHMAPSDGSPPVYVGRLGLTDRAGHRLLVDWRSPAAEPFFGATHGNPMGLARRRRYRWTRGRVSDYWDEVFTPDGLDGNVALDDQSAFIASLGSSRSDRMRDVLATIQADQDAIIRAGSAGALVVDGGPGTGKTVVALHRSAYLLYSDPRLGHRRGGVLFVGPHQPYLSYVADVLPSLGEEGVQICTLRDLVPEGATAGVERDPAVAALKASARMVETVEAAVRFYEEPPSTAHAVTTPWSDVRVTPDDWAEAFAAPDPGTPHNEAREVILEELVTILADKNEAPEWDGGDEVVPSPGLLRRDLARSPDLLSALNGAWPLLDAADIVADLWSVPAYLRRCAPWLSRGRRAGAPAGRAGGVDGVRPAAARRGPATARRPGVGAPATARSGGRGGSTGADGRPGGRPHCQRRLGDARHVHAARGRPAERPGRRRGPAGERAGPAGRPVRARRRGRGAGADRRASGRWCCCGAPRAASRSSATGPRPARASPSRGWSGSSGSDWTGSPWRR